MYSFSNLAAAAYTIFEILTLDGWTGILYNVSATLMR